MALRSSDDRSVETGLHRGIAPRRQFLRTLASGALAVSALPLLSAACGPAASTPSAAPPAGATGGVATNVAPPTTAPTLAAAAAPSSSAGGLPTYIPYANKPNPDFPSKGPQYEDGYLNYPANPVKSQPADPPGSGSTILATLVGLYPPATLVDQNPPGRRSTKR